MLSSPLAVRRAVCASALAAAGVLAVAACSGQIAANTPASNGISFVSGNGTAAFYKAGSRLPPRLSPVRRWPVPS